MRWDVRAVEPAGAGAEEVAGEAWDADESGDIASSQIAVRATARQRWQPVAMDADRTYHVPSGRGWQDGRVTSAEPASTTATHLFRLAADHPQVVATDLDGTLLRTDGTVGARTVRVLRRRADLGVPLVFVTGRPPATAAPIADVELCAVAQPARPAVVSANAAAKAQVCLIKSLP
jgi:hypothetical protein